MHGVPFVVVKASLHGKNPEVPEVADDEFAAVTFDGREGEVGNFGVGEFLFTVDVSGQFAQSGTQNDGGGGNFSEFGGNVGRRFFDGVEHGCAVIGYFFF